MKAYFKTFYPPLEERLAQPAFEQSREEVWDSLYQQEFSIDYSYFLTEVAGKQPKYPSFDLTQVSRPSSSSRRDSFITIQQFYTWDELRTIITFDEYMEEIVMVTIAQLEEEGTLGLDLKDQGAVIYDSEEYGRVKLADNLLQFLQKCTKRTPWSALSMLRIFQSRAIGKDNLFLGGFNRFPEAAAYKEIICLQQYNGKVDFLITRSLIVFFGASIKEYWLEELQEVTFEKSAYMQLAIKRIDQMSMTLDFGSAKEQLLCRSIHEQRALYDLLSFLITKNKGY